MSLNENKFWNVEDTSCLCEDVLNRYYLVSKKNEVSNIIKNFIYKLCENCAGIFNEEDIWSLITLLERNNCMNDEVLKYSSIQKFNKTSNPSVNRQIKEEISDLAVNKIVKHIDEMTLEEKEYRTECFTIDALSKHIKFGELISTLKYSNNGFDLNQSIEVNTEGCLDFSRNNVLLKIKEDIVGASTKRYIRLIIVKKMEK